MAMGIAALPDSHCTLFCVRKVTLGLDLLQIPEKFSLSQTSSQNWVIKLDSGWDVLNRNGSLLIFLPVPMIVSLVHC